VGGFVRAFAGLAPADHLILGRPGLSPRVVGPFNGGVPFRRDIRTGLPSFGTVKAGTPTRHRLVLVPVDRAAVGPGYLKVCYDRKQVKDAPSSDTDGEVPAACEEAIFKHYGLTCEPGAGGERRWACR
jgi:hypothetical protein